jgi:hypothetical protein
MTDIVERLRVKWDSMGDMANAERDEAANAIICLRNECAIEVAHTKEIRQQVADLRALLAEALAQRDEARREVCAWQGATSGKSFKDTAAVRGWDCFKEPA